MVFEFVSSHLSRVAVCVPRSGSYEMSWAAELELRRPYVSAHLLQAQPFCQRSAATKLPPRGPTLSALARVSGRGGSVILAMAGLPPAGENASPA